MLEQVRYVNHLNEVLYFGLDNMYINLNSLHDFEWDVVSQYDRIAGFERKIHTKTFPIRIAALSEAEGIQKRNELFEIPERDVLTKIPGRLIVNGYYLECFVTASTKTFYSIEGKFLSCDITVTTDSPFWVQIFEPEITFEPNPEYPDQQIGNFTNPHFFDSDFRIEFSGAHGNVVNPEIYIRGHSYRVNVTVPEGSRLVIDSLLKEVYIESEDDYNSAKQNVFGFRGRDSYIFQKIKTGINEFTVEGIYPFFIYLYDERSEPLWSADEVATWIYTRSGQNVYETTYIYFRPSGIDLYWMDIENGAKNFHLIEERSETTTVGNYFQLENGRLVVYHD